MTRTIVLAAIVALAATSTVAAETTTSEADRVELRRVLAKNREQNLKRFREYRKKGIYPHNTYEPGKKNVWIDDDGHLCAVATLMQRDGLEGIVEQTGKDDNFVRVAALTSGPLVDWVLMSGFTQEEVVMIQQPSAADVWEMEKEYRAQQRRKARDRAREDKRLAGNYLVTEQALKKPLMSDAGLDVAVERLARRPDLVKSLLAKR